MNADNSLRLPEAMSALSRIHIQFLRAAKTDYREFNLLCTIARKERNKDEGISIGRLAEIYRISRAAVSNHIKKIEKKGLVYRETDKSDRRVVWVKLTNDGKNTLNDAHTYWQNLDKRIEEKFGEKNLDLFLSLIDKLQNAVTEVVKEEKAADK